MEIVEKAKGYNSEKTVYVLYRSKTGMRRDSWKFIDIAESLDQLTVYLIKIHNYFKEFHPTKKFKYKILKRHVVSIEVPVSPQEIMLMKIKHGI